MQERDAFYRDLGARIRARREAEKMTQAELASVIGISRPSLTNIESGKQRLLIDQLVDISSNLTVPVQDLIPRNAHAPKTSGSDLSQMPTVANFVESFFAKTSQ